MPFHPPGVPSGLLVRDGSQFCFPWRPSTSPTSSDSAVCLNVSLLSPLLSSCYLKRGSLSTVSASYGNSEGEDPVMVFKCESHLIPNCEELSELPTAGEQTLPHLTRPWQSSLHSQPHSAFCPVPQPHPTFPRHPCLWVLAPMIASLLLFSTASPGHPSGLNNATSFEAFPDHILSSYCLAPLIFMVLFCFCFFLTSLKVPQR